MVTDGLLPSTQRALLHRLALAQHDGRAPSVVAGVVRDGALVWSGSRGAVEGRPPDLAYRIGSITKTFTATLIMQLRDEGRLELTDPLSRHLPELDGQQTLVQLLSHTSGITSEPPGAWFERVPGARFAQLAALLADEPVRLTPGSRLHYSNVAFALLGEIVARLRGTTYLQALSEHVLEPLGLTDTGARPTVPHAIGWAVHPYADMLLGEPLVDIGAMAPAGQLWSTVTDLARWLVFLGGHTPGVLAGATLEEMRQPASVNDGSTWSSGHGLGLQLQRVDERALVGHGGSMPGFVAAAWIDVGCGDGAVVMTNATSGVDVGGTALDLLRLLADLEPALPPPWSPCAVDPALLEITGTWFWGTSPLVVSIEGPALLRITAQGGGRSSRFHPAGDGAWTGADGYHAGEQLRVVRDERGAAQHLDLATFVYTRRPYQPSESIPGGFDDQGWQNPEAS